VANASNLASGMMAKKEKMKRMVSGGSDLGRAKFKAQEIGMQTRSMFNQEAATIAFNPKRKPGDLPIFFSSRILMARVRVRPTDGKVPENVVSVGPRSSQLSVRELAQYLCQQEGY